MLFFLPRNCLNKTIWRKNSPCDGGRERRVDEVHVPTFSRSEFLTTTKPYEYLYGLKKSDPFGHEQALAAIKDNACAVGVRNFNGIYAGYVKLMQSCQGNI